MAWWEVASYDRERETLTLTGRGPRHVELRRVVKKLVEFPENKKFHRLRRSLPKMKAIETSSNAMSVLLQLDTRRPRTASISRFLYEFAVGWGCEVLF
eukprot:TRINITY_DN4489_c0_g1_i1.p2 TRINITY_DN4489_c0_g1~~TRINITY_DN4489_c0_g1_i1.p2  ORF type:complete len:98 (-),score=4.49 TRINITY_DN4489_c0_g1_i1:114-407(-)